MWIPDFLKTIIKIILQNSYWKLGCISGIYCFAIPRCHVTNDKTALPWCVGENSKQQNVPSIKHHFQSIKHKEKSGRLRKKIFLI